MIINKQPFPVLPNNSSPRDAGVPQERAPGQGAAWLREMEKLAMMSWLSHDVQTASPVAPVVYARISPPTVADESKGGAQGPARHHHGDDGADGAQASGPAAASVRGQDSSPSDAGQSCSSPAQAPGPARSEAPPRVADEAAGAVPDSTLLPAPSVPAVAAFVNAVMTHLAPAKAGVAIASQRAGDGVPAANAATGGTVARSPAMFGPGFAGGPPAPVRSAEKPSAEANRAGADTAEQVPRRVAVFAGATAADGAADGALRIHAVWSEQTVRVWIGADQSAGLSGQQLACAALDIRRLLREQGASLESLTYNGEAVLAGAPRDADRAGNLISAATGPLSRHQQQ